VVCFLSSTFSVEGGVLHYDGTFIAFVKLCSAIVLYRCNDGGAVFQLSYPVNSVFMFPQDE